MSWTDDPGFHDPVYWERLKRDDIDDEQLDPAQTPYTSIRDDVRWMRDDNLDRSEIVENLSGWYSEEYEAGMIGPLIDAEEDEW